MLKYDYALLKLDGRVARQAYIRLGLNYIKQEEQVGLSGYPGAFCSDEAAMQSFLWKGKAHELDSFALNHKLSTFEGNSGSPLFVRREKSFLAIAIHKGSPKGVMVNCGRLITQDLLANLLMWEKDMTS